MTTDYFNDGKPSKIIVSRIRPIKFALLSSEGGEIAGLDALIFGVALFLISASLVLSVLKLIEMKQRLQELSDMVAREMVLSPSPVPAETQAISLAERYEPIIGLTSSAVDVSTSGNLAPCSAISISIASWSGLNLIAWPIRVGIEVPLTATSDLPTDGYHYAIAGEKGCVAP